jgi:uncharacterized protein (TIGR03083 family)
MLLDGVARVGRGAKNLSAEQWNEPACGRWSAQDTARHLLSLSRSHHRWLDAGISGDTRIPYTRQFQNTENHAAIEFLADIDGTDAIAEFVRTAGRYANRVADHWDTPIGVPGGVITAGQHCALTALEYHLHAWDLAQMNNDTRYEPPRVRQLLSAAGEAQAAQASSVDALKILTVAWVRHRYHAWRYLLSASGRTPSRHSPLSALTAKVQAKSQRLKRRGPAEDHVVETNEEIDSVIDLRGDSELPLPAADDTSVSSD